jgi:hypothetical protein
MARQRTVAPGFFKNEDLGSCSALARLLFAGLWCWADREGRVEDRPRRLRAEILPYDQVNGEELVAELETHGLVSRYEVDGVKVLEVVNFRKYQDPHPREAASTLPARSGVAQGPPKANPGTAQGEEEQEPFPSSPSCPSRPSGSDEKQLAPPARARDAGSADRAAVLHGRDETFATKYPKTAALIAACERLGEPAAWAKDAPTRASAEAGIGAQDIETVAARVVASIQETSKPWLGMNLAAIRGLSAAGPPKPGRPPDPRAAAAPSAPESFKTTDTWSTP